MRAQMYQWHSILCCDIRMKYQWHSIGLERKWLAWTPTVLIHWAKLKGHSRYSHNLEFNGFKRGQCPDKTTNSLPPGMPVYACYGWIRLRKLYHRSLVVHVIMLLASPACTVVCLDNHKVFLNLQGSTRWLKTAGQYKTFAILAGQAGNWFKTYPAQPHLCCKPGSTGSI
jgi:hypothetical protein